MTWIKICGITDISTAQHVCKQGADAIGFVFAESKRAISVEQASVICKMLPDKIKKIGVFVNREQEDLRSTFKFCQLDMVQLHGEESSEFCSSLKLPYIKALRIQDEADLENIDSYPDATAILLDSFKPEQRGGTGLTFPWKLANKAKKRRDKLILAGGLHVDNVQQAIKESRAWGVDVSSGLETAGRKDLQKISDFIAKVRLSS